MPLPDARIAVLGGGPAGAAACLALARAGERPLWLARPPRAGDRPGEFLSAAARPILGALGAADVLNDPRHRPANAVFSAWGRAGLVERSGMLHLEGPGTVLDRPAFEAQLVVRATEAGLTRHETEIDQVRRDGGRWRIATGAGEATAAFLIDATGRAARAARDHATRFRADRLAALCAFLPQDPASDVAPTRATLIETVPGGWWYATLLGCGRLAVNFYTDADLMPAADLVTLLRDTTHIRRWIAEAGFDTAAPVHRASAATVWLAPAAGPGWAAAGDAAAAFDPLSSHGLTSALWGGRRAAEVALADLSGDGTAAPGYAEAVARGVHDMLTARTRVYRQERRFAESLFWARRLDPAQHPDRAAEMG